MAVTISSFVYIDNCRYIAYDRIVIRTTDNHHTDEGERSMDLVSRLDLVDALVRDRQRDSDAAIRRHAALAAGRTRRQPSLTDRLTVVLGGSTSPSRIASAL
jgi:DNA-binding transcriptional regulator LsrR (DeoR family)